jgi:hypothetical protein
VPIRFTRAMGNTASSVGTLDAACAAEYGANYQLGDSRDVEALWKGALGNNYGSSVMFIATYSTGGVNSFYIAASTAPYIAFANTPGSFPVACVQLTP